MSGLVEAGFAEWGVPADMAVALDEGLGRARGIVEDGTAPNTARAYRSDLAFVSAWCGARGLPADLPMPRKAVALLIVDCARGMPEVVEHAMLRSGAKRAPGPSTPSTLARRVAALSVAHDLAGAEPNPCRDRQVRRLLAKARSADVRAGWRPVRKAAAHRSVLEAILPPPAAGSVIDVRDRAMLLFGFSSGGRRRSEVASATMDRLEEAGDDYLYRLGLTKTSRDGETGTVPVAGAAASALRRWLAVSGVGDGPVFRPVDRFGNVGPGPLCDRTIARVVKRRAALAGLDPAPFAGHSLRSGFMTEAGNRGLPIAEAMAMSTHRNVQVAMGYYQAGDALRNRTARLMD